MSSITQDQSENVFDNVKNMFRRAEGLAINSVTEKLSRMWRSAARKVAEANSAGKYETYETLAEGRRRVSNVRLWSLRGLLA